MSAQIAFWQRKRLHEMTDAEWDSLCDGCGKCCLRKLQDADSDLVYYTDLACKLLDLTTCRCTQYAARSQWVPDCVDLRKDLAASLAWLPPTCAYRLLDAGMPLPDWHPLLTGNPDAVHLAKRSVRGQAISEEGVDERDWEDHLIYWV